MRRSQLTTAGHQRLAREIAPRVMFTYREIVENLEKLLARCWDMPPGIKRLACLEMRKK